MRQDYYSQKQAANEEMEDYLFWMVLIAGVLALAWAAYEIIEFLRKA
jgi:hypothetical protein